MAILTGDEGGNSDVQSATAPTASTPPPPAAGQENGLFSQVSQVAQQAAQPAAQAAQAVAQQAAQQAPPKPKLATPPKGQTIAPVPTSPIPEFDFNHPSFDPSLFSQRFTDVVNQFKDKLGTNPSLSVAHDLTRSGLNLNAIGEIAQHIGSSLPDMNGSFTVDIHGLPADWKNVINGDELAQLHSKPIVAVQNAPWQGLKWDGEKFLANLSESAPAQVLKREIQKSLQTPEDALAFLNEARKTAPSVVASAMDHVQRGDFLEAAAKVRDQLGTDLSKVGSALAGQAASGISGLQSIAPEKQKMVYDNGMQALQETLDGFSQSAGQAAGAIGKTIHGQIVDMAAFQKARSQKDIIGMIEAIEPVQAATAAAGAAFSPLSFTQHFFEDSLRNEGYPEPVVQAGKYIGMVATIFATGGAKNNFGFSGQTARSLAVKGAIGGAEGLHVAESEDPNAPLYQKILDPLLGGWQGATMAPKTLTGPVGTDLLARQAAIEHFRVSGKQLVTAAMDEHIRQQTDKLAVLDAAANEHLKKVQDVVDRIQAKAGIDTNATSIGSERDQVPGLADWEKRQKDAHAMPEKTLGQKVAKREALKKLDAEHEQLMKGSGSTAADPTGTLPPVPEGHVRLYRGEDANKGAETDFEKPLQGRWFTDDPRYSRAFAGSSGYPTLPNKYGLGSIQGQFKYVDVPHSVADQARLEHLRIKSAQAQFHLGHNGEIPSSKENYDLQLKLKEKLADPALRGTAEEERLSIQLQALRDAQPHIGDMQGESGFVIPQEHADRALAIPHEIMDAHIRDLDTIEETKRQASLAQERIQELNRIGEQGEPMAKAVDAYWVATAKISDAAPADPEMKALNQQWSDAMEAHSLARAVADNHREMVRRMIAGDREAPETKVGDAFHYLLDRDIPKDKAELGGINISQATQVMAQELGNAIRGVFKEVGDTAANHAQFRAAMENADFLPQISNDRLRALAINMHSFNAKMATRIPESLKVEIIRDYYPRGAGLSRERFERTVRSDNPLPVSTSHLHERTVPEDDAEVNKAHPADEYRAYAASMGQALVNRNIRATIRDASVNGKPVFVSHDVVSDRTPPDNGLKYTKSTLAGLEGWLETDTHDRLAGMAKPVGSEGIGKAVGNFNSWYKTRAMVSLQHYWNQFSAAIGVDKAGNLPLPGSLVRKGMAVTHDPAEFATRLAYVFAQPERWLAEVADNTVAEAPHLAPALDALRAVENQTMGRFEHLLWTSSIRNVQFGIHDALRVNLRAKHGDKYTDEDYNRAAGYMAGQITGIQSPKTLRVWERQVQKYIAFAYSWNRKHITLTAQSLPLIGDKLAQHFDPSLSDKQAHLVQELSQDYITRYTATSFAMLTAASLAMGGKPQWENEKGHEFDINWTRLHDMIYGADGKEHYATFPPMMFLNFFHSKAQAFDDAMQRSGGNWSKGVIDGLATNFANIAMPIPSWFAQTVTNVREEDVNDLIGRTFQQANPFQRNFFGPMTQQQPPQNLGDAMGDLGSFFGGFSGIKASTGAHRPFNPPQIVNQDRRASALTLARMGIDPATASDADWAKAEKQLHQGEILGVNPGEVAQEIEGRRMGTDSAYDQMNKWADQTMNSALIEAGLTQAQIDKAKAEGGQPIHLLTPSQERKMFDEHPELQYILDAPPVSDDPTVIKAHADMTKYNSALSYTYSKTAERQKALDAEYESGKITLTDWKSRIHDIRQQEKGAIDDAWHLLTPDEQHKLSLSPQEKGQTDPVIANSPLLAAEQAYWDFRQIATTGNYDQPDGTVSPDLRKAQNAYMAGLSADMQQYILNREAQTQTPLQQKYYAAADKYGKFKDQNSQWEEIRSAYDSMPKFQRDLLKETYPDFSQYMTYRENYFKENQDVADFYHLTDFKAYQQKPKLVQAMDLADYFVTHYGKHPEYNTPWADSVVTDPKVWAQVTAGWDQATYNQFLGAYNGYYQNQADQRAKFHDFLTQLFARRRTVKTSSGTGSVLGG